MKIHFLPLAAFCAASTAFAAPSEIETPAKASDTSNQPAPAVEQKSADPAKTTAEAPPADLAKRIQLVTNPKSAVVVEVVKMIEAGIDPSVIEAYVQTAVVPSLRPDEILFLHEKGVSAQVITTLIKRSGEMKTQQVQAQKESQERLARPQTNPSPNPAPAAASTPATFNYYVSAPPTYPGNTYVYPAYTYAYPVYTYGYGWPYYSSYYSSVCPPSYATRFNSFHYSHQPHASLGVGIHTPRATPFFSSRWTWNGTTGKPVDFYR